MVGHFKEFLVENTSIGEDDWADLLKNFAEKFVKKPVAVKEKKKKATLKKTATDVAADGEKPKKRINAYNIFMGKIMSKKVTMKDAQVQWKAWKEKNPDIAKDSQKLLDKWVLENETSDSRSSSGSSDETDIPKPVDKKKAKAEKKVEKVESDDDEEPTVQVVVEKDQSDAEDDSDSEVKSIEKDQSDSEDEKFEKSDDERSVNDSDDDERKSDSDDDEPNPPPPPPKSRFSKKKK